MALTLFAMTAPARGPADDVGMDVLLARMDRLWAQRDAPEAMHDMITLGVIALAIDSESYEAMWRVARAYAWVAHTQPNRLFKKAMAVKSMEWAEHAKTLQPARVEGHYFYALSVGEYAMTVGIMKAVMDGVAGKIETSALEAYALDREFEYGGAMTVLGRYYYVLPWPKRDLDRSRRYLEDLKTRYPGRLLGRFYLAETYYALGEKEKARAELEFVLRNDPLSGTELDQPPPKAAAREALTRWFPGATPYPAEPEPNRKK
jgi:tetratricopeptide (TPR) repeat protein